MQPSLLSHPVSLAAHQASPSLRLWTGGLSFCAALLLAACGGGGGGDPVVVAVPTAAALQAPADITADAGKQRVTLNWSNVPSATSFTIYYGPSPGISKASAKIADAHSIYVMRDLPNGAPVYLAVAAVGPQGEGALSAEVSATPTATPPQPAPVNVRAQVQAGRVDVSWDPGFDATADPTTYTVYYGTAMPLTKSAPLKVVSAGPPQAVSGLVNGTQYYFGVTATTANGEGAMSYVVSATPQAFPPPAAPQALAVVEGNGQVTLSWNASAGATGYKLYFGTEFGVNRLSGTAVAGVSSPYVLSGLANNTAYFFVVSAVGPSGEGFTSSQVSATPVAVEPVQAMVSIPGGTFAMGDNLLDPAAPASYATPVHNVTVSAFTLDRHETTYAQWRVVYDWAIANGYDFDSPGRNGALQIGTNMPVTQVSWYDVVKWLNARSEKEGRNPVYFTDAGHTVVYRSGRIDLADAALDWTANGYRLPTDAEWEWAARGALAGQTYPWGNVLDPTRANYDRGTSTSVGSYPANGYGLRDMAGNVWEWTWDWQASDYSADAAGVVNPHGPASGAFRTRRGGSYVYGERYLRNFDKMFRVPTYSGPYFGFRSASSQP